MIFQKVVTFLIAASVFVNQAQGRLNSKVNRDLQACQNSPVNWSDSEGFDCAWYTDGNNCAEWGHELGGDGQTARQACCACGGGQRGTAPAPTPPTPTNANCPAPSARVAAFEDELLRLINQVRGQGYNCGSLGYQRPAGPVQMDSNLRCASRRHSKWMADTGMFEHDSPGGPHGDTPAQRARNAGFQGVFMGENINAGQVNARESLNSWLTSDGHCENLMNPGATLVGLGYYYDANTTYRHYWTQKIGTVAAQ